MPFVLSTLIFIPLINFFSSIRSLFFLCFLVHATGYVLSVFATVFFFAVAHCTILFVSVRWVSFAFKSNGNSRTIICDVLSKHRMSRVSTFEKSFSILFSRFLFSTLAIMCATRCLMLATFPKQYTNSHAHTNTH